MIFFDESNEARANDTSVEAIQSDGRSITNEFDPISGNDEPIASGSGLNAVNLLSTLDWSAIQSPSMQNSTHSANENANDVVTSTPEQQVPMFVPIRWRIPKLIPIRFVGKENNMRAANVKSYGRQLSKQVNKPNASEVPSGKDEHINKDAAVKTTASITFESSPNFGTLHYDSDSD